MIKLSDGGLINIIPPNIGQTTEAIALCYCLDNQVQLLLESVSALNILSASSWDNKTCDYLAAEFRTPFYDQDFGLEKKRNLIKNSLKWFMSLGTTQAVEDIIETVLGDAEIEENVDGAYTFSVNTTDTSVIGDKATEFYFHMEKIKNVRSDYKGINVIMSEDMNFVFATVAHSYSKEVMKMVY